MSVRLYRSAEIVVIEVVDEISRILVVGVQVVELVGGKSYGGSPNVSFGSPLLPLIDDTKVSQRTVQAHTCT